MFIILITLTFNEPGNPAFAMNTVALQFNTKVGADMAAMGVQQAYPKNAIYATVTKLYGEDY